MKNSILILALVAIVASCQNTDKKSGSALSDAQKEQAAKDTANFTTIQWLDSTFKDLGKVKDGQIVEVTYRFKNTGTKPLIISSVSASCGCTVPEKPEQPFAAGEEGVIKAKFDSRNRPHGEARKEVYVAANTNPEKSMILSFRVEITE